MHAWRTIAAPAGHNLLCLVGWNKGRMVAVWPLVTCRKRGWKYVQPLNATGAESADILTDDTLHQQDWIRSAWRVIRKNSKSDVILLPYVRTGTALRCMLSLSGQRAMLDDGVAFCAHLRSEPDWDSFYGSLSKTHRRQHAVMRRRLAELGSLQFEIIPAGDPRCPQLVDWLLTNKRTWAERTGKKGPWLFAGAYREFLVSLLADSVNLKALIMSLTLDGTPICLKIAAAGKRTLEGLIAGFDVRYEKYSPGNRLDEYGVKWAFEQKLDYDFGIGTESFKKFWSRNGPIEAPTFHIANSWWGQLAIYLRSRRKALQMTRSNPGPQGAAVETAR
jgi:CelD/BcsL family acetyltransferase involved in cellulose biosynthesis